MTKPDAVREPMTNIATDVIEGYKTGLAGGPMGFVSAAFDCGWLTMAARERLRGPRGSNYWKAVNARRRGCRNG